MDDLFRYPPDGAHGGDPTIKSMRHRARTANSFRAVWEPVTLPEETADPPHRLGGGRPPLHLLRTPNTAPARIAAPSANARIAVLPAPRIARGLDIGEIAGEIAHPVVDAAIAVRQRVHVETWGQRLLQRGLEILPLALALTLISSLVWGAFFLPIPLVVMLLGFDIYWAWRSLNSANPTAPSTAIASPSVSKPVIPPRAIISEHCSAHSAGPPKPNRA